MEGFLFVVEELDVEELLVDVELVGGTLPPVVKPTGVTSICNATLS